MPLDLLARPVPFFAQLLDLLAKCLDHGGLGVGGLPSLLLVGHVAQCLALCCLDSVALSVATSSLLPVLENDIVTILLETDS